MKLFLNNKKNLILALIFAISASALLPSRSFAGPEDDAAANASLKTAVESIKRAVEGNREFRTVNEGPTNAERDDIGTAVNTLFRTVPSATKLPEDFIDVFKILTEGKMIRAIESVYLAKAVFDNSNLQDTGMKLFEYLASEPGLGFLEQRMIIANLRLAAEKGRGEGSMEGLRIIIPDIALSRQNIMQTDNRREEVSLRFLSEAGPILNKFFSQIAEDEPADDGAEEGEEKERMARRLIQAILSTNSVEIAEKLLGMLPKGLIPAADLQKIRYRFDGTAQIINDSARTYLVVERPGPNEQVAPMSAMSIGGEVAAPFQGEGAVREFYRGALSKFYRLVTLPEKTRIDITAVVNQYYYGHVLLSVLLYSFNPVVREAAHTALSEAARERFTSAGLFSGLDSGSPEFEAIFRFLPDSPALCFELATESWALTIASRGIVIPAYATEILARLGSIREGMEETLRYGYNDLDKSRVALPHVLVMLSELDAIGGEEGLAAGLEISRQGVVIPRDILRVIVGLLNSRDRSTRDNAEKALEPIYARAEADYNITGTTSTDTSTPSQKQNQTTQLLIRTLVDIPTLRSVRILTKVLEKGLPHEMQGGALEIQRSILNNIERFLTDQRRAGIESLDEGTRRFIDEELCPAINGLVARLDRPISETAEAGQQSTVHTSLKPDLERVRGLIWKDYDVDVAETEVERAGRQGEVVPREDIPTSPAVRAARSEAEGVAVEGAEEKTSGKKKEPWYIRWPRDIGKWAEKVAGRESRRGGRR